MHPDWLGSPQHFVAGAVLAWVVAAVASRRQVRDAWVVAALAIGVTMAAEAAVELVEYPLLYADDVNETAYFDTLADTAATLAGALLGAAAYLLLRRRPRRGLM